MKASGGRRGSEDYRTLEETRAAFMAEYRTDGFEVRWYRRACRLCRRAARLDPQDLLQDTLLSVWSGARRWARDLPWDVYFLLAMMTKYYNARRHLGRSQISDDIDVLAAAIGLEALDGSADWLEERSLLAAIRKFVEERFADRPDVLGFAHLRMSGASRGEVMLALGIGERRYNNLYKVFKDRLT